MLKFLLLLFVAISLSGCLNPYVPPLGLNRPNGAVVTAGIIHRLANGQPGLLLPTIVVDLAMVDGKNLGGRYVGVPNVILIPGVHKIDFEAFYAGQIGGPGEDIGAVDLTANFQSGRVYSFRTTKPFIGPLNWVESEAWVQDDTGARVTPVVPFVLEGPCIASNPGC